MTRQMADDSLSDVEVLATLDLAANDLNALSFSETGRDWSYKADLAEARAAVVALQAERDDLNTVCDAWETRAERAEAALKALRGQVVGLLNTCVDVIEEGLCASQSYDYRARAQRCAQQIKEVLTEENKS